MDEIKRMMLDALASVDEARSQVIAYRESCVDAESAHMAKLALNRLNVARYEAQRACEAVGEFPITE